MSSFVRFSRLVQFFFFALKENIAFVLRKKIYLFSKKIFMYTLQNHRLFTCMNRVICSPTIICSFALSKIQISYLPLVMLRTVISVVETVADVYSWVSMVQQWLWLYSLYAFLMHVKRNISLKI